MSDISLSIHKFSRVNDKTGLLSALEEEKGSSFDQDELISHGRGLVKVAFTQEGWKTIVPLGGRQISFEPSRTYVFKRSPPVLHYSDKHSRASLREWGDLCTSEEDIDLVGLMEFKSMDASWWLNSKRLCEARERKRARTDDEEVEVPNVKRRKDEALDFYEILPQPHHHPYPHSIPPFATTEEVKKRLKPYTKSPFRPISPHTVDSVKAYLVKPFARSAWVIPVCGRAPWDGASSGDLKSEYTSFSAAITWTPTSLKEFWNFLLEVRRKGVLGAISLSYHVGSSDETAKGILRCTHIKVYHDARFALHVRAVLDAWRAESHGSKSGVRMTARLLLGRRLPLLDEQSDIIGIC